MSRFFFDFVSPAFNIRDEEGVELSTLADAHRRGVRLASWIRSEFVLSCDPWRIEVKDEQGNRPLAVLAPGTKPSRQGSRERRRAAAP